MFNYFYTILFALFIAISSMAYSEENPNTIKGEIVYHGEVTQATCMPYPDQELQYDTTYSVNSIYSECEISSQSKEKHIFPTTFELSPRQYTDEASATEFIHYVSKYK